MLKRPFLLLLVISGITLNVNAQLFDQSIYARGIMITKDNDTITGYIAIEEGYSGNIKYKINQADKKNQKVDASSINYIKIGYDYFDRVNFEDESELMKRIVEGEISLYKYFYTKNSFSAPTYQNKLPGSAPAIAPFGQTVSNETTEFYLVRGGVATKLKKRKYQEVLKELMSDNQNLNTEIDKLKFKDVMFDYDLKNIISKYNYWFKYTKGK